MAARKSSTSPVEVVGTPVKPGEDTTPAILEGPGVHVGEDGIPVLTEAPDVDRVAMVSVDADGNPNQSAAFEVIAE